MPTNVETSAPLAADPLTARPGRVPVPVDAEALTHIVTDALSDRGAQGITVLDVRELTDINDVTVIASGRSTRHVRATAEHVIERSKAAGCRPLGVEGLREGEWVLVDLGDLVLHVMTPETRETYRLEKLWGGVGRRR